MDSKYDNLITSATSKHLPENYDWRLLKSQLWQESRMDPNAVNGRTNATGLGQFMLPTWREWAPKAGYPNAERTDPRASIYTAAAYMNNLLEFWYFEREDFDRYCLALASYNAGAGNLLKAQGLRGGKIRYCDIIPGLPKVTGINSIETINYVQTIIGNYCNQLLGRQTDG